MKLITDRYEEIKDRIEFEDSKDELIVECYKHKIFREKPSKRFKEEFKEDFDHEYPVYLSDITRKLANGLKARIKFRKDEEAFEEKVLSAACKAWVC